MRIYSHSFDNGQPIPPEFAAGTADGFSANRNPHLAWDEVPDATASFALICIDPDVPTVAEMVGRDDVEIPIEQPRTDFIHWVMIDIPAGVREIAAGSCSEGVTPKGKRAPQGPSGSRQGLNDYTGWFAGTPEMAGDWLGYDGPWPPGNDLHVHRYFFRLFALDVAQLEVPARFTAANVLRAIQGHVLAETALYGTYSLHPAQR